jgi:hypothetical protein
MNKKEELLQEFKLRRLIRKAIRIKHFKEEKKNLVEEQKLRKVLRALMKEEIDADTNPAPQESTALSALADAFNQILPILKTGLRKLKIPEERQSYRAHILQKFSHMFSSYEALDSQQSGVVGESDVDEGPAGIKIAIDDPNRVMPSDGKEDERFKEEPEPELEPDDDDIAKLAIETEDPTGARRAFTTINNSNIQQILADTRKLLVRPEDKAEFKAYAMYNVDLWLLTYEKELADENGQPPAFDSTVTEKPSGAQLAGQAQEFDPGEFAEFDMPEDDSVAGVGDIPRLGESDVELEEDAFVSELEATLLGEEY